MKKFLTFCLFAVFSLVSLSITAQAAPATPLPAELASGQRMILKKKWDQALREAKEKNLPIMIRFSDTKYCMPCREWDKDVFTKPDVKKHSGAFCVVLDYEKCVTAPTKEMNEMKDKYQVKGIPTVIIVNTEGKVIAQNGFGCKTPEALLRWMKNAKK